MAGSLLGELDFVEPSFDQGAPCSTRWLRSSGFHKSRDPNIGSLRGSIVRGAFLLKAIHVAGRLCAHLPICFTGPDMTK